MPPALNVRASGGNGARPPAEPLQLVLPNATENPVQLNEVVVSILACHVRFNLNCMKNSFTYQAAKIWNSLESDVRKENLFKFAMSIKSKSFKFHFF